MREDWALVVGEQPYKEARGTRGPTPRTFVARACWTCPSGASRSATDAVLNPNSIAAVGQTTGSDDGLEGWSAARPLASKHPKDIRSDRKG